MRAPHPLAWSLASALLAASLAPAAPIQPDAPGLASSLRLWLKADALGLAPGSNVATWTDSSAHANHAVALATTVGGQPLVPPTVRGADPQLGYLPSVAFARANAELLRAPDVLGDTPVTNGTILAVYRVDSNSERGRPVGFGSLNGDGVMPNRHWNLAPDPSLRFDGSNIGSGNYSQGHPTDRFLVRTCTKGGQTFDEYFDGTQVLASHTHGPALNVLDEFDIGDLHHSLVPPPGTTNTHVAEVIVYDRVLTSAERQGVEAYLQQKYFSTAGYWRFENGTAGQPDPGTADHVRDSSNFGNHGTANASGTLPVYSADVPSRVPLTGQDNTLSLRLDRANDNIVRIEHDPSISFGDNAFTIEAWVKMARLAQEDSGTASRHYLLFKKRTDGVVDNFTDYGFLTQRGDLAGGGTANSLTLQLGKGSAGGSNERVVSALGITDYQWHYVSVAFDPTTDLVRFILDGQMDFHTTAFVPGENDGDLILGGHYNGAGILEDTFDGWVDELRISRGFLPVHRLLYVPEPGTLGLMAVGLAALARRRRRRS